MSAIQSVNDPFVFQFVVGACASLLVIVNGLVAFILRGFKKDNEELKLLVKENNKEQRFRDC